MSPAPRTPKLYEPLALGAVTAQNRLWVAPMCQYSAHEGLPQDWHFVHLGALAAGRPGLIVAEATSVSPEGRITPKDVGIWNDEQQAAWAPIVSFVHAQGVPIALQLAHAGRKASTHPPFLGSGSVPHGAGGWQTVGPSPVAYGDFADPRELTLAEIAELVAAFAAAARRAVAAGFDALEIHGAHGYLLHQFLSPLSNQRIDAYGGSFENRTRFLREVVRAVRGAVPAVVPVWVRLSATDWVPGGWDVVETQQLVQVLEGDGVDLISVSSGGNDDRQRIPVGPGYQVPLARQIREVASIPVGVAGVITEPLQAETVLVDGAADVVFVARQVLREPGFALRAATELGAEVEWPRQYRMAQRRAR